MSYDIRQLSVLADQLLLLRHGLRGVEDASGYVALFMEPPACGTIQRILSGALLTDSVLPPVIHTLEQFGLVCRRTLFPRVESTAFNLVLPASEIAKQILSSIVSEQDYEYAPVDLPALRVALLELRSAHERVCLKVKEELASAGMTSTDPILTELFMDSGKLLCADNKNQNWPTPEIRRRVTEARRAPTSILWSVGNRSAHNISYMLNLDPMHEYVVAVRNAMQLLSRVVDGRPVGSVLERAHRTAAVKAVKKHFNDAQALARVIDTMKTGE